MPNKRKTAPNPMPGGGYSTDTQMATAEPCIDIDHAQIVYSSEVKSTINMGNSQSFNQIQNILGYTEMTLFLDDTQSIFADQIQDSIYTLTFHFYEQIIVPTQIIIPQNFGINALNGLGQFHYNKGLPDFRDYCGDKFIYQIHNGANLYVAFQIVFATLADRQVFEQETGHSGFAGLYDTSTTIKDIVTNYNLAGTVNLMALQNGGNPSDLGEIFTNSTNGYYISSCSLSNLNDCQQVINGVLDYSVNNFPNQVNITNGDITGNAVQIGASYMSYASIGLNESSTILTPEILQDRATLTNSYESLQEQEVFVSHLLSTWVTQYMQKDVLTDLQGTLANITSNINLYLDQDVGVIACYNDPTSCDTVKQNIINSQAQVNTDFIDSFATAFQLQYEPDLNHNFGTPSVYNGIAMPLGNGNFVKKQASGFTELLQITYNGVDTMSINEPNMNGGSIVAEMSYVNNGTFYGTADNWNCNCGFNGVGYLGICFTVYVMDNPI